MRQLIYTIFKTIICATNLLAADFYPGLSSADAKFIQNLLKEASIITDYTREQLVSPSAVPSLDFLSLNPETQKGVMSAVECLKELESSFPHPSDRLEPEEGSCVSSSDEESQEDPDEILERTLAEFFPDQALSRGRSISERAHSSSRLKSKSPPKVITPYVETAKKIGDIVQDCHEARERFPQTGSSSDILKAAGSVLLKVVETADGALNDTTLGAWHAFGEVCDDVIDGVETGVRRASRSITGDQYTSQVLGEVVGIGLSLVNPGKLSKAKSLSSSSGIATKAGKKGTALPSGIFSKKIDWTSPVGTRQTYNVHQRNDIDWDMIRTSGRDKLRGITNKEAALRYGAAPQLQDGNFATLHHIGQDSRGGLVEASRRYHGVGKYGQNPLHSQYGKNRPHPEFPVDHKLFTKEQAEYWKWRANQ